MTEHGLTAVDGVASDGLDSTWECDCGEVFDAFDVDLAFDHGWDARVDGAPRPMTLVVVKGGTPQHFDTAAGYGDPILDYLDLDREGEDDENRLEWLQMADGIVKRWEDVGRGLSRHTLETIEKLRNEVRDA